MSKNKQAVKRIAKEALDLVITARKKELEEKRREQVRLNRGHDATWEEMRQANKIANKVLDEIKNMGVDTDKDLNFDEGLVVLNYVVERAKEHAFDEASRKAASEAAEEDDMRAKVEAKEAQFNKRREALEAKAREAKERFERDEADRIDWAEALLARCEYLLGEYMTAVEFMNIANDEWHEGADDECAELVEQSVAQLVEERKRAKAEALVSEATRGTMTLDDFTAYVNSGEYKRDVEEALKPFEGLLEYLPNSELQIDSRLARLAYGEDEEPANVHGGGQVKVEDDNTDAVTVPPVVKWADGGIEYEVHVAPDFDEAKLAEVIARKIKGRNK